MLNRTFRTVANRLETLICIRCVCAQHISSKTIFFYRVGAASETRVIFKSGGRCWTWQIIEKFENYSTEREEAKTNARVHLYMGRVCDLRIIRCTRET